MPKPKSKLTKQHLIASAIILALAFGMWLAWRARSSAPASAPVAAEPSAPAFRDPLTGLPISEEPSGLPRVYAVMIDNSVDAWPQSGVDKAFLVIEAPVEAAIPRLEAFFEAGAEVDKVGPVRSARPYFVDWADEFDALYAHVGGSNAALDLIASRGTFDLNEFSHGGSYWRASDRSAPHNAYTSSELLAAAVTKAEEKGRAPSVLYGTWTFAEYSVPTGAADQAAAGPAVSVRFNSDVYTAEWQYDAETGTYLRSQGGRASRTEDGVRLDANNVAVVVTDVDVIDAVGRREIRTTGTGRAWLLQGGVAREVTWKKPSVTERLAFYDEAGREIEMFPGKTWIEVVPDESDVTVE